MERTILRGEVYYANLDPVIGSEQGGIRPVLIIQNDTGNRYSPTVIIAPITGRTKTKANIPTHILVAEKNVLQTESIVLLEQIKTIDKQRLKGYVGSLDMKTMVLVDGGICISLGLI